MARVNGNISFERIVPQISLACALIVFAFQLTAGSSLAGGLTRAFLAGLAIQTILLATKVAIFSAVRLTRLGGSTRPGNADPAVKPKEMPATRKEQPRGSRKIAA